MDEREFLETMGEISSKASDPEVGFTGLLESIGTGRVYENKNGSRTWREICLDTAKQYVLQDRNSTYDEPEQSFGNIAALWSIYLDEIKDQPLGLTEGDVAVLMILMKVARLMASHESVDNWIDIAGYAACGLEVTRKVEDENIR